MTLRYFGNPPPSIKMEKRPNFAWTETFCSTSFPLECDVICEHPLSTNDWSVPIKMVLS